MTTFQQYVEAKTRTGNKSEQKVFAREGSVSRTKIVGTSASPSPLLANRSSGMRRVTINRSGLS